MLTSITKRFVIVLLVVVAVLGVIGIFIEREIGRLESAMWDRGALQELEPAQQFLQRLANGRVLTSWQARACGLLGDLAHHRAEYEDATNYYSKSMEALGVAARPSNLVNFTPSLYKGSGDFSLGYNSYESTAAVPAAVEDVKLMIQFPAVPGSEVAWGALVAIPQLQDTEASAIHQALPEADEPAPDFSAMKKLCEDHRHQITALRNLSGPLVPPDPDDMTSIHGVSGFIRLLMLDAICQIQAGDVTAAASSFDNAYSLLGVFENNPRLVTLMATLSIRTELADMLESGHAMSLQPFFKQRHCLGEAMWEQAVAGEYQAMKRLLTKSMSGSDPQAKRLRTLVMNKQTAFWRVVRSKNHIASSISPLSALTSAFFFKNRRFFQRAHSATRADGLRVAAELENHIAEIVHRIGCPNIGNLDEQFTQIRSREAALTRNEFK